LYIVISSNIFDSASDFQAYELWCELRAHDKHFSAAVKQSADFSCGYLAAADDHAFFAGNVQKDWIIFQDFPSNSLNSIRWKTTMKGAKTQALGLFMKYAIFFNFPPLRGRY
jgi:hypothetical protein